MTRSIATPPGWDASPSQVTSQHFVRFPWQFAGTHLLLGGERHCESKVSSQEHNTMTRPGLEPGPLDPESSTLTTRPLRLPKMFKCIYFEFSLATSDIYLYSDWLLWLLWFWLQHSTEKHSIFLQPLNIQRGGGEWEVREIKFKSASIFWELPSWVAGQKHQVNSDFCRLPAIFGSPTLYSTHSFGHWSSLLFLWNNIIICNYYCNYYYYYL